MLGYHCCDMPYYSGRTHPIRRKAPYKKARPPRYRTRNTKPQSRLKTLNKELLTNNLDQRTLNTKRNPPSKPQHPTQTPHHAKPTPPHHHRQSARSNPRLHIPRRNTRRHTGSAENNRRISARAGEGVLHRCRTRWVDRVFIRAGCGVDPGSVGICAFSFPVRGRCGNMELAESCGIGEKVLGLTDVGDEYERKRLQRLGSEMIKSIWKSKERSRPRTPKHTRIYDLSLSPHLTNPLEHTTSCTPSTPPPPSPPAAAGPSEKRSTAAPTRPRPYACPQSATQRLTAPRFGQSSRTRRLRAKASGP